MIISSFTFKLIIYQVNSLVRLLVLTECFVLLKKTFLDDCEVLIFFILLIFCPSNVCSFIIHKFSVKLLISLFSSIGLLSTAKFETISPAALQF